LPAQTLQGQWCAERRSAKSARKSGPNLIFNAFVTSKSSLVFAKNASKTVRATARFRVQGSGFRVQGLGFRAHDSGFRVQGSGFRVPGSGLTCQVRPGDILPDLDEDLGCVPVVGIRIHFGFLEHVRRLMV